MKLSLLWLSVLFSGSVFAQTKRISQEDQGSHIKEIYYVLKSDKNIKQGPYKSYAIFGDRLLCEGFYKNDLKDSLWKYYGFQKIAEIGSYKNDKKTGVWNAYNYAGDLEVKYDFSKKILLFHKTNPKDSAQVYSIITGGDTIKTKLQQPPIFLDGSARSLAIVVANFKYPRSAKEANIQGKVVVSFKIDTAGNVSDYRVKSGIQHDCDEEALRVVKLIKGDWLPGILNGKPVDVEFELPLNFSLSSE